MPTNRQRAFVFYGFPVVPPIVVTKHYVIPIGWDQSFLNYGLVAEPPTGLTYAERQQLMPDKYYAIINKQSDFLQKFDGFHSQEIIDYFTLPAFKKMNAYDNIVLHYLRQPGLVLLYQGQNANRLHLQTAAGIIRLLPRLGYQLKMGRSTHNTLTVYYS